MLFHVNFFGKKYRNNTIKCTKRKLTIDLTFYARTRIMWTLSSCVPIKRDGLLIIFASASPFYLLHFFFTKYRVHMCTTNQNTSRKSALVFLLCACVLCNSNSTHARSLLLSFWWCVVPNCPAARSSLPPI